MNNETLEKVYENVETSMSHLSGEQLQEIVMASWLDLRDELGVAIAA